MISNGKIVRGKPTPDELFEFFDYHPNTGKCYWKIFRGGMLPGQEAGSLSNNGHWRMRFHGRDYLRSHVAFALMTGRWPAEGMEIDHINRNSLDDRWDNLREATSTHQKYNTVRSKVRDLPRGVRHNGPNGYQAVWSINSKVYVSPTFHSIREALAFREKKINELQMTQYLPE